MEKMSVQVLVATMNQNDDELVKKMNIQSDAIVVNQCGENQFNHFMQDGNDFFFLSLAEKGVGLNRNNALMRATADFCILADDDLIFADGYVEKVKKAFNENPKADVIIFNLLGNDRIKTNKKVKVGPFSYMKYGAARIAFRRKKVSYAGIYFNQNFGGGTPYSCGEDTIFLYDCLKAGLKIIHVPMAIAKLDEKSESTWFEGYTEKYFYDRGILHANIYRKTLKTKILLNMFNEIYLLRRRFLVSDEVPFVKARGLMKDAVNDYMNFKVK